MQIASSDFQDQLIRGLTHRMNNILSLFHGYLGLLTDDRKLDPILREGINRIRDGAFTATELIERTNAISRPASQVRSVISLPDFFRQLGPTFETRRPAGVEIEVECPASLPDVQVDLSRMRLAVLELVGNAFEAATSRVRIRVSAGENAVQGELFPGNSEPQAHRVVRIEVIDDGAGIPKSQGRRIFEPFFSTKKTKQSAGLGLSVAAGCIQQFGGTLSYQSRKGETVFEVTLPVHEPQQLGVAA